MAWNGRVVKTYGRHRRRIVKNEAWVSPEIMSSAITNVFSSPDTDISNGSIDATHGICSKDARPSKQPGCKLIISPLARAGKSNKENTAITLAPETPEDEQGTRQRIRPRKGQKCTGNKEVEHTPKLFSSDSEDGLRKVVGRKALMQVKTNVVETRGTSTRKQPASTKASAPQRRVKNVIKNDIYTIIRSPPPRCQKSSKRYRSSKRENIISTSDSNNTSMSPFSALESWIDVIAATSTPMVALTKLPIGDGLLENSLGSGDVVAASSTPIVALTKLDCSNEMLIKDGLLEDSLGDGDGEHCVQHRTSGRCNCKTCRDTDKVANKLFELTLSGDEDGDEKDARRDVRRPTENDSQGRGRRRRNVVNYKDVSDEEDVRPRRGRRPPKSLQVKTRQQASQKLTTVEESSSSSNCSIDSADVSRTSDCSVSLKPLSKKMQALHLKAFVCEDQEIEINSRLRTRGQSQDEESDKEKVLSSRSIRTRGQSRGEVTVEEKSKDKGSLLIKTRAQSQSKKENDESNTEDEEKVEPIIRKIATRGQSRDSAEEEGKGPVSRRRIQGQSSEEDDNVKIKPSGRRRLARIQSTEDESEGDDETELTPRRIQTRGRSREHEEESDGEEVFTVRRIHTRGQSGEEEDEEPMCLVTPRKKHLASFHTDSFKASMLL
ncbi:uncharacterized protein [Amphiura filiformis]|uniref:uncharacterized protein n=1 Tax=Amphiura filiformis TaxID=82378 RepID=UPI003B20EA98